MGFKIEMGAKVRDVITGLEGTVVGRHEFITGCRQYGVVSTAEKNETGNHGNYDENRLEVIGPVKKLVSEEKKEKTYNEGGPATEALPTKD